MELEGSLPHLQFPSTCPYPEPGRSSPWPHTPLPEDPSYCYPPTGPGFPKWTFKKYQLFTAMTVGTWRWQDYQPYVLAAIVAIVRPEGWKTQWPHQEKNPQPFRLETPWYNNNNNNNNNISKSLRKYVSNIPGKHEVKELQKTAILSTAHILLKVLM